MLPSKKRLSSSINGDSGGSENLGEQLRKNSRGRAVVGVISSLVGLVVFFLVSNPASSPDKLSTSYKATGRSSNVTARDAHYHVDARNEFLIVVEDPKKLHALIDSVPDSIPFEILGYNATFQLPEQQLIVQGNASLNYWVSGAMVTLCSILAEMNALNSDRAKLIETIRGFHNQSHYLSPEPLSNPPAPLLNLTMPTSSMGSLGQGNYVTAIYCVRLAVARYGVALQWQCLDQEEARKKALTPWFMGSWPAPTNMSEYFSPASVPSHGQACEARYPAIRLDFMAKHIQQDTRNMAIALVGNRSRAFTHPNHTSSSDMVQKPWYPDAELDDVVIHFRCGDVMGGAKRNDFGMIKFIAYKQYISREAKSVGIITQPFHAQHTRAHDRGRVGNCQRAAYLLVDYLHDFLGNDTRVTIHNGVNETLPLAYARMVMANQSICSLSSFGIFPVIGTFGQGYYQIGNRGVNPFNVHLPAIMPNLHTMNAPVMGTWNIWKILALEQGEDKMMNWFVNETATGWNRR